MKSQSVTNLHGRILFLLFLCGNLAQVYDTGRLFLNDYNTNQYTNQTKYGIICTLCSSSNPKSCNLHI